MSDLESGLKEAVESARRPHLVASTAERKDLFDTVRADTRGAVIRAWRDLGAANWVEADDRMLDMLTAWLDNVRGRQP